MNLSTKGFGKTRALYKLVQGKHPKCCQPRMPHAIDIRMSHTEVFCTWYHAHRHEQWKRVAWPVFCSGPRTGASGEHVPHDHCPSKR